MRKRNRRSWYSLINAFAANGQGVDGLMFVEEMRRLGLQPNAETFLAVLMTCASAGAVREGLLHFWSMRIEYGIAPGIEHHLGVIDILRKAGFLDHELDNRVEALLVAPGPSAGNIIKSHRPQE
ncbi:PPR CONTAINING PLANT-LIKE PROTEIN [Salix viminalis]|uniref:PPR CONTAINING PLANT-LIKE PROTEIN n=1 Tax=Salix viminalis TaxID=40686 RepID=A0A9Q0V830_SALVM|nr:PPR CONTAINING PLANT-LIKE PROTEIN [Salix viminalis]